MCQPKKIILVVDDLPENLDVIRSILVPDYTVHAVTSGALALTAAQSQIPDLILLDIIMPNMDGYEVCQQLKQHEVTRNIPVIFVTIRNQMEDEAYGLGLGAVDYITKPIKPSILRARIRTHLALADAMRQLTIQNQALIEATRLREDIEGITRHDLKAPLHIIIGIPQLLLRQCDFTDKQRRFVHQITVSGYRMLDMINRSLDIFKMENGVYKFKPERVDLLAVIRGVLEELAMMISEKQLRVDLLVGNQEAHEEQRVETMAESLLCHSMFSNLCRNAIEASPGGGLITIRFSCHPTLVVSIENVGEVPPEIRERFFEKFVTAGKNQGTGFGTYSAMLIARIQKGTIELDTSIVGRTCIRVNLMAAADQLE
ncbi:conserved hypothetical protein [Gammaproteobacteria bacterium]